ncbi:MAG: glucose 1-dehydrogenase, partial [Pseudomonadota bacterium]
GVTHLPGQLEDITEEDFDRVYHVNMKSVFLTAQAFVSHFKEQGAGAILNVASTAGISPRPRLNWYNASKGWMITATKAMAVELAPNGIRVNAINPVAGDTPLLKSFMGEDTPEMRAKFLSTIPIGRFSTPEDMGNAACFLCSDEASMITGVAMEVDGGRCI